MNGILNVASMVLTMCLCGGAWGGKWYVDGTAGNDSNSGQSPGDAFKTIQRGIDAASHGDTVTVAAGTYLENIRFDGKNIMLTSKYPDDPWAKWNTTIDGNGAGSVVTFSGTENETCVLSGFTIENGMGPNGGGFCGGTETDRTQATIQDNIITLNSAIGDRLRGEGYGGALAFCDGTARGNFVSGNSASNGGGGMAYCDGEIGNNVISSNSASDPFSYGGGLVFCNGTVYDNWISGNSSHHSGGGLMECHGTIVGNTIRDNSSFWGGGLHTCDGIIQGNTISLNSAVNSGGGVCSCSGTIQNNVIADNSAVEMGGGVALCGSILPPQGPIQNNIIVGNSAGHEGGAVYLVTGPLRNNLVAANSATRKGGGLYECRGPIDNNTVVGNSAGVEGGGLYDCQGSIRNCIFWGNKAPNYAQVGPVMHDIRCSCIQDWGPDPDNTYFDPRFVDADGLDNNPDTYEDNDYRLSSTSPCIDDGCMQDWMWDAVDLDGNNRVIRGKPGWPHWVDMGAYEYGSFPFKIVEVKRVTEGEVWITWNSRPGLFIVWSRPAFPDGPWTKEADDVLSLGNTRSWVDTAASGKMKFYRVEMK